MVRKNQILCIVGLGYVGLPLAVLAAQKGYEVVGLDISKEKVDLIRNKQSPYFDIELMRSLKTVSLEVTTDFSQIKRADIIVICVPTPVYKNRLPNYKPVESACKSIAPFLKRGDLVILESTVNPGVCEELVLPILEKYSGLRKGAFYLAHCPERINPGDSKWNVSNIARVVGGVDEKSLAKAVKFYRSVISAEIKPMGNIKEAEAVKVVENSFRNINIAFVNELAQSFSRLGIDVVNVIEGASSKPFAFLPHYPGCGIGGHCIPVDPYYLIDYAKKNGYTHRFLSLACKVNEEMPQYTTNLLKKELNKLGIKVNESRVAVLGLAYKANIGDCRESPSFEIIHLLKKLGVKVKYYDPYVIDGSRIRNIDEALNNIDAVVIATNHKEFLRLNPDQLRSKGVKIVIDGRNCLNKDQFAKTNVIYRGIGR